MVQVSVRHEYAEPATKVWDLVGGFDRLHTWAPGITGMVQEGSGIGAVRVMTLAQGNMLRERLESHDDAAMSHSYSIVEGPLPVKDYLATLKVVGEQGNRCTVEWSAKFEPAGGMPPEKAARIVEKMFQTNLAALEQKLKG